MNSWAPLWSGIVESSLWDEPDYVVKVFLTMLAVKDGDHICRFNAYQIGRKSRKDEVEVLEALRILSSPDTRRHEVQEYDGRRIKSVEEGWLILNAEKYREMVQIEMRRASWRKAQKVKREREREASLRGKLNTGEGVGAKALDDGELEIADRTSAEMP